MNLFGTLIVPTYGLSTSETIIIFLNIEWIIGIFKSVYIMNTVKISKLFWCKQGYKSVVKGDECIWMHSYICKATLFTAVWFFLHWNIFIFMRLHDYFRPNYYFWCYIFCCVFVIFVIYFLLKPFHADHLLISSI
jgi:hypothetical protein